jgi:hypothetical protein
MDDDDAARRQLEDLDLSLEIRVAALRNQLAQCAGNRSAVASLSGDPRTKQLLRTLRFADLATYQAVTDEIDEALMNAERPPLADEGPF